MVESTVALTKSLRDKSKPLLELLPTARSAYQNEFILFFPQKEEWLIEWLVERLYNEQVPAARLFPESWRLLHDLLSLPSLNLAPVGAALRKHKFVDILAKTFADAIGDNNAGRSQSSLGNGSEDVDMQDSGSSASSSVTELGSPLVKSTFERKVDPHVQRRMIRRGQEINELLTWVFKVVEFLDSHFGKSSSRDLENPKRRRLELSTPVLKGSPEAATTVLESYFKLLRILVQAPGAKDRVDGWTYLCQSIWKSCSYGVSDFQRLASLVSGRLLTPIAMALSFQPVPDSIQHVTAWLLGTYIFQPVSSSKAELLKALKPLADVLASNQKDANLTAVRSSLPEILRLAIEKADRDYSVKQRRHADGFVSVLLSWMLSMSGSETAMYKRLLDVAISNKIVVDKDALNTSLDLAMQNTDSIDWGLLGSIAQIDLDSILSSRGVSIFSSISAIGCRESDESMWQFIAQVIRGSVETRDFEKLLARWSMLLTSGSQPKQDNIWHSDRFQRLISSSVESGLTQTQVEKNLLRFSSIDAPDSSPVIVDSILRGMHRIGTVDKLGPTGIAQSLLDETVGIIDSNGSRLEWKHLRILIRTIDIWSAIALQKSLELIKEAVLSQIDLRLQEFKGLNSDSGKELSLLLVVPLLLCERSLMPPNVAQVIIERVTPLLYQLPELQNDMWDGEFDSIDDGNKAITSFVFSVTERFTTVLSDFESDVQHKFIIGFLYAASRIAICDESTGLRSAWSHFVDGDSKLYDNGEAKDIFLSAILGVMKEDSLKLSQLSLVLEALSNCPLSILKRSQREGFIDLLFPIVQKSSTAFEERMIFNVINRLTSLSANSSVIASSIGSVDGIYKLFSRASLATDENLDVKIDLTRSILRHLTESRHHEKAGALLSSALKFSAKGLGHNGSTDFHCRAWAHAVILGTSSIPDDEIGDISEKLGLLKGKLRNMILNQFENSSESKVLSDDFLYFNAWDMQFLQNVVSPGEDGIDEQLKFLLNIFSSIICNSDDIPKKSSRSNWLRSYGELICKIAQGDGKVATAVVITLFDKGFYHDLSPSYRRMVSSLEADSLRLLLEYVTDACFSSSQLATESYFAVLHDILVVVTNNVSTDAIIETALFSIFSQIALAIPRCSDFGSIQMLLNSMILLIRRKGSQISQINVEEALVCVAITTSNNGPVFDYQDANTDSIFIPLCSIAGNILSTQRFRIKGRHSLMIAALNGLMGLLFRPKSTGRKNTDADIHPPWLNATSSCTVTKEAGLAYCKLLTLLCDPSTSSVRTNKSTDDLSSATMAAKKAVEIHVPGLIKRYIGLNLTHSLASEVKTCLMPGFYSIFDVMSESTMRSLNASLDSSERVMFKSLYEDWNKFGKWVD